MLSVLKCIRNNFRWKKMSSRGKIILIEIINWIKNYFNWNHQLNFGCFRKTLISLWIKKIKAAFNCKFSKLSILVLISYIKTQEKIKNFGTCPFLTKASLTIIFLFLGKKILTSKRRFYRWGHFTVIPWKWYVIKTFFFNFYVERFKQ